MNCYKNALLAVTGGEPQTVTVADAVMIAGVAIAAAIMDLSDGVHEAANALGTPLMNWRT
jgi:hypothetical protein